MPFIPRSLASLQYDPAHFNRYFEDKECKYNAGAKTEYASPPSSAGPQPPTATTGKTSMKKGGAKNSSTVDLEFVPLVVTSETGDADERSTEAEIKCEMSTATFDYANVEIWSDKRSNEKVVDLISSVPHWESEKTDHHHNDQFNKIHPFQVERVGRE